MLLIFRQESSSLNTNIKGAGLSDLSDNDAVLNAGKAEITVTTGSYGEKNHTLDMGFRACGPLPCGGTTVVKN